MHYQKNCDIGTDMNLLKAVRTIGGWTMLSRVCGFVRDVAFAIVAGAGQVADVFFVAFRFPNMFRALFAEGAINAAFVPTFTKHMERYGQKRAEDFIQNSFTLMAIFMIVFVGVGIMLMPQIMFVQASGFYHDREKFELTISLSRILFPYLGFMVMNALFSGVLNSLGNFSVPAGSPVILNVCSIIVLVLVYMDIFPLTGYELAIGVLVAGVLQMTVLIIACYRAGLKPVGIKFGLLEPTKTFFKKSMPVIFGASLLQLNIFIGTIFATTLASGSVSYLYYADRLVQLPLGVIGIAIGVALLPLLSRAIEKGDRQSVQENQSSALVMGVFLTLPATIAFLTIGHEIVMVLFQHGAFDSKATHATALALKGFAFGLPAFVLVKVLTPAFFARDDTKTPVRIAVFCMIINIILSYVLMQRYAHFGLAIATSISAWVNVFFLIGVFVHRGYEGFTYKIIYPLIKIFISSGVMSFVLLALLALVNDISLWTRAEKIIGLAGLVFIGKMVYFVSNILLRTITIAQIKNSFKR